MPISITSEDLKRVKTHRAGQDLAFYADAASRIVDDALTDSSLSADQKKDVAIFFGVYLVNAEAPVTSSRSVGSLSSQNAGPSDVDPYLARAYALAGPDASKLRNYVEGKGGHQVYFLSPAIEDADI